MINWVKGDGLGYYVCLQALGNKATYTLERPHAVYSMNGLGFTALGVTISS